MEDEKSEKTIDIHELKKEKKPIQQINLFDDDDDIKIIDEGISIREIDGDIEKDFEDEVFIQHHQALGIYSYGDDDDEKESKRNRNIKTMNMEKVSEGTTRFLQKAFREKFSYEDIRKEAIETLDKTYFKQYSLRKEDVIILDEATRKEKVKIRNVMIEEQMNLIVSKALLGKNTISVKFDKFFEMMDIASVNKDGKLNVSNGIRTILNMQKKAKNESVKKFVRINDETNQPKIYNGIVTTYLIPEITFIMEEDSEFKTLRDLQKSKKRNKEQYIKHVEISFDLKTFASKIVPLMNYVRSRPSVTRKYKLALTRSFDPWIRSLYRIQWKKQYNRFTFEQLKEKFGHKQYSQYSAFKFFVLNPIIDDFNQNVDLHVELYEDHEVKNGKKTKKIKYVSFIITLKNQEGNNIADEIKYTDLAYYITVQHIYHHKCCWEEIPDFEKHKKEIQYLVDDILRYENIKFCPECEKDKTFDEWRKEHHEATEDFEKLLCYEAEDKEWFASNNMKVSLTKLCLVNIDTDEVCMPFGEDFKTDNPIKSLKFYEKIKEASK